MNVNLSGVSLRKFKGLGRLARGFSLVEILIVIAALGVLASVAVVSITGVPDEARKAKLEQDVAVVNNAIDTYLAAGGDAAQLTEGGVISALKQRVAPPPGPGEIVGPQGPFLDTRVITKPTDFAWSALYTTDPQPRFYVVQSRDGVVFDTGPAMAVGGAAERLDAARGSWVWDYTTANAPGQGPSFVPTAIDAGYTSTNIPLAAVTLDAPVFSPASLLNGNLWEFPVSVSIANPNPAGSSRIYYKAGTGGNYALYDGTPFNVDPGTSLTAIAVSLDPSRYYNSPETSAEYTVVPLQLAVNIDAPGSVTYAQAGGLIVGQDQQSPAAATITLGNTNIPAPYLRSANFNVRYTTDGTDPLSSGTAVAGPDFTGYFSPLSVSLALAAWGTNTSMTIRAAAIAANTAWFESSPGVSHDVALATTTLPVTLYPVNPLGLPSYLAISNVGAVPVGVRTYYTTDGSAPLTAEVGGFRNGSAPLYSGSFNPGVSSGFTFSAQATGPSGYEQWFASPLATKTYSQLLGVPFEVVGANIGGGDINGSFRGSVFVSAPADLGIFNAGGQILGGNLFCRACQGSKLRATKRRTTKRWRNRAKPTPARAKARLRSAARNTRPTASWPCPSSTRAKSWISTGRPRRRTTR